MRLKLQLVTAADVPDIVALRIAVAGKLTATYGAGFWSGTTTEKSVLFAMRNSSVYIARRRGKLIATLALGTKKPWAIDRKYFGKCDRPLYLTSMAVAPELQRQGIGRLCVEAAKKIAKEWPENGTKAIFLDAYDVEAGAGEFYRKCGFREVGHASYRGEPLIYFEMFV
jgi:GNAT superfamily N-acetyltransferase